MRVAFPVAVVAAVLSVGAAGCGGGETSAAESWADDVCTSVADWKEQIRHAGDDVRAELRSPSTGTLTRIGESVESAADATRELADDLQAVDAPDVDSGEQAKQQVDAFAGQLETTVEEAKQKVEDIPESTGLSEIASALATLLPSLQSLANQAKSALDSVEASGNELKQGFENADACKPLR
jgi:uncharacterized phage infection (PIP) family protein YhgE